MLMLVIVAPETTLAKLRRLLDRMSEVGIKRIT